MDKQLPTVENFKAIEAEPEPPEPWWKRYYSYIFYCAVATAGSSGYELLDLYGWFDSHNYAREMEASLSPDDYRAWLGWHIGWAALIGLGGAVSLCLVYETKERFKRYSRLRPKWPKE
jgi:hypothetical protein